MNNDQMQTGKAAKLIFVVEDEPFLAERQRLLLGRWGYETKICTTGEECLESLEQDQKPFTILLDLIMPGMGGLETLRRVKQLRPDIPVIILSGQEKVEVALEAFHQGAYDYLVKPVDDDHLSRVLQHAVEKYQLASQVMQLREEVRRSYSFDRLVGRSKPMKQIFRLLERTLFNDITVLIEGESGTGKELVARAIHYNGSRAGKPFVVVNCAAIPRELVESELFGHEKGSFTGAHQRKLGKFELADQGTLFLDEIGELEAGVQGKLLRALQEREIERVGGTKPIPVDVRLVAATKRNLSEEVEAGRFREDLYYRVNTFPIPLPPLQERSIDIPLLARHFLDKHAHHLGREDITDFTPEVLKAMQAYSWPGNVRQLENIINRAMVLADREKISLRDMPEDIRGGMPLEEGYDMIPEEEIEEEIVETRDDTVSQDKDSVDPKPSSLKFRSPDDVLTLEEIKAVAIKEAFRACNGNVSLTAKRLDIGRATLYRSLEKYGLTEES